ncbi:MAG: hypothetical protein ACT6RN_27145 [Agrobacterium sp.]|uniref:hypothetical protein n=1 Tax=Agrobacterium sp. TaxID=361 RepID=UPI0040378E50
MPVNLNKNLKLLQAPSKTSMKGIPFMLVVLKSYFFSLPATGVDAGGGSSSAAAPGVFPLVPPVAAVGRAALLLLQHVFPVVPPLAAVGKAALLLPYERGWWTY